MVNKCICGYEREPVMRILLLFGGSLLELVQLPEALQTY